MKPTPETLQLPDGRTFDLERKRWDGPLDQAEVAFCRARGIPLAFDCAQSGWVLEQSGDASLPSAAAATPTPEVDGMQSPPHNVSSAAVRHLSLDDRCQSREVQRGSPETARSVTCLEKAECCRGLPIIVITQDCDRLLYSSTRSATLALKDGHNFRR